MMLMRMLTVTIGMKMHEYDNGDDVDADTLFQQFMYSVSAAHVKRANLRTPRRGAPFPDMYHGQGLMQP